MVRLRTLVVLALLTALAVAAAVVLDWRHAPAVVSAEGGALLPGLEARLNDVDRIDLTGAGDRVLTTLRREASGWTVAQRNGYPADIGALRSLLLQLAQARLAEPKTTNPARYAVLGVEDVAQPKAGGVQLALHGAGGLPALIVGHYDLRAGGTFVRRAGEARSWLVAGDLRVDTDPAHWLDRAVADIPAAQIREVTVKPDEGPAFTVYKAHRDASHYSARELERRRELAAPYAAEDIAAALAGLELDDVYPASTRPVPADLKAAHLTFRTWDGLIVDADAWQQRGQGYLRLRASAVPAATADAPASEVAAEAARLNARWDNWTYCLPAYRYAAFARRFDSLQRPPRDATPSPAPAASAAPAATATTAPALVPAPPGSAG
ncbi:MAG TPA: DUF4340 domain-containing protein [Mizugakiibacter sp.]